jgi:hypothetical protein
MKKTTYSSNGGVLSNEELIKRIEALGHKAKVNSRGHLVTMANAPLIYDYRTNRFQFLNSAGNAFFLRENGKFGTYKTDTKGHRKGKELLERRLARPNLYQTVLEDEAFTKHRYDLDKKRRVDYDDSQELIIDKGKAKGVPISKNLIDSVQVNLPNRKDQSNALGISSTETAMGKFWPYYIATQEDYNDTRSVFKETGSVTPTDLMNDHNYFISPMRGTLNNLFGVDRNDPLVYGSSNFYYRPVDIDNASDEFLDNVEPIVEYDRYKNKYDVNTKRTGADYFNPENNPYVHAIQYLQDKNYNMGSSYPALVSKNAKPLEYLLNGNIKAGGGYNDDVDTSDWWFYTGDPYVDTATSFAPWWGTAMDLEKAIRQPSFANWGWALTSLGMDIVGVGALKAAAKSAEASVRATKAVERYNKAVKKLDRATEIVNKNPHKGTRRIRLRARDELSAASRELEAATKVVKHRKRGRLATTLERVQPTDYTPVLNSKTIFCADALVNGIQTIFN